MLSNQVYPEEVGKLRTVGYLEGGTWTKAYVEKHYPEVMDGVSRKSINAKNLLLKLKRPDQIRLGEVLFQYHCNDCHAVHVGYSAVGPLLQGRSEAMILETIENLDHAPFFMPPWAGTREEAQLLAAYLSSIAPPRPAGMSPQPAARPTSD